MGNKIIEEFDRTKGLTHYPNSSHAVIFQAGWISHKCLMQKEKVCPECGGEGLFEPCSHIGCLAHTSHPCEGCGRVNGECSTCKGKGTIPIYYTPEQYERITGKSYPDDAYIHYGVYLTNTVISRNPEVCEESNFSWRQPVPYENHKNHKNVVIVQTAQPAPDADYRPEE